MSFLFYTVLHVFGIMVLFASFGALAVLAATGGASTQQGAAMRRLAVIGHGVALILILVGGFGLMLKKLAIPHDQLWPGWLYAKIAIWLFFGASLVFFKRKPELAKPLFLILPLVGLIAGYLALYKPF